VQELNTTATTTRTNNTAKNFFIAFIELRFDSPVLIYSKKLYLQKS